MNEVLKSAELRQLDRHGYELGDLIAIEVNVFEELESNGQVLVGVEVDGDALFFPNKHGFSSIEFSGVREGLEQLVDVLTDKFEVGLFDESFPQLAVFVQLFVHNMR